MFANNLHVNVIIKEKLICEIFFRKEVLWVLTNKKETTIKNVPVKKAHEVLAKLGISIEKMKVVDHKNCLPNSAMIKGTRMDERLKKRKPRKSS